jgi:hypothetical protein
MPSNSAVESIDRPKPFSPALAIARSLPLLACALLAACSTPRMLEPPHIDLIVAPDANQNSPFAFELVYVFDQAALARLPRTSAEWFQPRPPGTSPGGSIQTLVYELVPGLKMRRSHPAVHGAIAVVGYANYIDQAGQPMIDLTGYRKVTVRLGRDRVDLSGER